MAWIKVPGMVTAVGACLALALALALIGGCSDSNKTENAESVTIERPRIFVGVGTSDTASVTVSPPEAAGDLEWKSLDWGIAGVEAGVVTGVGEGVTRVVASAPDGGPADTCVVIVAAAFYTFEGSAADETGNGADAIVTGATPAEDRHGDPASAYSVSWGHYLTIPADSVADFQNGFTLAGWLRWDQVPHALSCWLGCDYHEGFAVGMGSGGSMTPDHPTDAGVVRQMLLYVGDETKIFSGGTDFLCDSTTWYHVAVTFDDAVDIAELYVNGVLSDSKPHTGTILSDTKDIGIGRDSEHHDTFVGIVDDVGIFTRRLTAGEISLLYGS